MTGKSRILFSERKTTGRNRKQNRSLLRELEAAETRAEKDPRLYSARMKNPANLVEFDNLCTSFFSDKGIAQAVDGVSFDIPEASVVAVVGESGCGKTATALSLMRLLPSPGGQVVHGEIRVRKHPGSDEAWNIASAPDSVMESLRGRQMAMVFQDPETSLNPVYRIGQQVEEAILLHRSSLSREEARARTLELLDMVGIADSGSVCRLYPQELSGGMKQRVLIAIALACRPELLIADEPTASLDVTIQAQILALLKDMKKKAGFSILLITHDLDAVAEMADYVVVMYAGHVVEKGTAEDIFRHPSHPYTLGLLRSRPVFGKREAFLYSIPGMVPGPYDRPAGCPFKARCEMQCKECDGACPPASALSSTHVVSCYRFSGGKGDGGAAE